ncbi:MAG: hypothetical protein AB1422_18990 [bacterium]
MGKILSNVKDIERVLIDDEVLDWYALSPAERFEESQKLWEIFLLFGGDYDPEPDTQSPFYIFKAYPNFILK